MRQVVRTMPSHSRSMPSVVIFSRTRPERRSIASSVSLSSNSSWRTLLFLAWAQPAKPKSVTASAVATFSTDRRLGAKEMEHGRHCVSIPGRARPTHTAANIGAIVHSLEVNFRRCRVGAGERGLKRGPECGDTENPAPAGNEHIPLLPRAGMQDLHTRSLLNSG